MRCSSFHITGRDQIHPDDFATELKNVNFKESLINFIIDDWNNDYMAPFIENKQIYLNFLECYKYEVVNNRVQRTKDFNLSYPAHEEADTKIVYHICQIDFQANITIRCSDTDAAIIMLAHMENTYKDLNISMEVGVKNHQRFINLTKLYENLGPQLSAALLSFHALTDKVDNPIHSLILNNIFLDKCFY